MSDSDTRAPGLIFCGFTVSKKVKQMAETESIHLHITKQEIKAGKDSECLLIALSHDLSHFLTRAPCLAYSHLITPATIVKKEQGRIHGRQMRPSRHLYTHPYITSLAIRNSWRSR